MDEEIKGLRELLEKNLEINKQILQKVNNVNKFIMWQKVFGFLKILLIVVPIILGFLYLPGILKNVVEPYKELLNGGVGAKANILQGFGIDEDKVPENLKFLTK